MNPRYTRPFYLYSYLLDTTLALAQYSPAFVPRIIAAREDWNGWLAVEATGTHPTEDSGFGVWTRVTTTLAELQIASIGQTLHLLNTGCRDARVCSLLDLVEPFLEVMAELMERQSKESPPPLSRNQLLTLRTQLLDTLSEAGNSEIPDAIGHLDFNPGNIVANRDRCVFLDWAEGAVSHPFLTFQYLLENSRRFCRRDESWEHALTSVYIEHWQTFVSRDEIRSAFTVSRLLAVFAYAVCGSVWTNVARRNRPETRRHLVGLVWRLKREADAVSGREVPCLF